MVVCSAMDGPAIIGSNGDQMWQYSVQWMVQLFTVARGPNMVVYSAMDGPAIYSNKGTKCGSVQCNAMSSYYK